MEATDSGEGEVGEGGLEWEGGHVGVGAEWSYVSGVPEGLNGRVVDAYKPDWVELEVLCRSSKTLESFGICGFVNFVFWVLWIRTYLYFETVEEISASCEFEPHENPRHKFRAYRCDSRYLSMLLATRVNFVGDRILPTWKGVKGMVGKGAV